MTSTPGHALPRAAAAAARTSCCRCRAARRSSTRRTPPRSSGWPTSSRVRACSRPASAPGRCRARCCAPSATRAWCRPTSGARTSPTSPAATSSRSSAVPHPAWQLTVGDLHADAAGRRAEGPTSSSTASVLDMLAPWDCVDVVAEALVARRRARRVRRHHHPALAHGRDAAHRRPLDRAARPGVAAAHLAPRGPRRAPRPPHDRPHRLPDPHPPPRRRHRAAARAAPARPRAPTARTTSSPDPCAVAAPVRDRTPRRARLRLVATRAQ